MLSGLKLYRFWVYCQNLCQFTGTLAFFCVDNTVHSVCESMLQFRVIIFVFCFLFWMGREVRSTWVKLERGESILNKNKKHAIILSIMHHLTWNNIYLYMCLKFCIPAQDIMTKK